MIKQSASIAICTVFLGLNASLAQAQETVQTRIGPLSFTHGFQTGYPTKETVDKLYEELDFQRAVGHPLQTANTSDRLSCCGN